MTKIIDIKKMNKSKFHPMGAVLNFADSTHSRIIEIGILGGAGIKAWLEISSLLKAGRAAEIHLNFNEETATVVCPSRAYDAVVGEIMDLR